MTEQQFIEWSWIFTLTIFIPIAVYLTMFTEVSGDTALALVLAGVFGPFTIGLLVAVVCIFIAYGVCAFPFYLLRELGKKIQNIKISNQ